MSNNFVHLNVHTEYSLLNNYNPMKKLISKAKELNFNALAITDYNNMYGVIEFYKLCKKNEIKPVIGVEITLCYGSSYHNIILLAKNNEGYKNLCRLVSKAHIDKTRYTEHVTIDELTENSENLICLIGSRRSLFYKCVKEQKFDEAKEELKKFKEIFGENNIFIELFFHFEDGDEKNVNDYLKISEEINVETVVTNDVHYLENTDFTLFNIARCIASGQKISDLSGRKFDYFNTGEYYLKSEEDILKIFSSVERAINNTKFIADRCNVEFDFSTYHLPEYEIKENFVTKDEYLYSIIFDGAKRRYNVLNDEIIDRIDYEFSIIKEMGFIDYFLIVWDFVNFAKKNKIPVGPGRGSGANSIVAYCLGITDIDPIEYGLIFERFLNPERISMPDFDIDFSDRRRDEVIAYVIKKYGKDRVTQIVTFGTMQPRAAIRDIGRVLDYPLSLVDKVAKLIPSGKNSNFEFTLREIPEFKKLYEEDLDVKKLVNTAIKFEGFHRHISIHAAGIVVTKKALTEYIPLSRSGDNIVTQYNMTELEELGLLKIDFLGLRTLTVIDDAVKLIKKNHNVEIDIDSIDLTDDKVINLFRTADTIGVFQFESFGMREFLKSLKADTFEELVAANSLFRPGPMSQIPLYIRNKNNRNLVTYPDNRLEKFLKGTYGIIVYQEQVMQIVRELAGYTWGGADNLRKAISKKKMDVMEYNRQIFIYGLNNLDGSPKILGCVRNGVPEETAKEIFDHIVEFGNYAFNKSHSACYTLNAFRTAYLKCYYPLEYMTSLINSVINSDSQFELYLKEIKKLKFKFLLPNINKSEYWFTTENNSIRTGFVQIRGVGNNLSDFIVEERKNGEYKNFIDFLERNKENSALNLTGLEALIKSGCFDYLEKDRGYLLNIYESLYSEIIQKKKNEISGQISLIENNYSEIKIPEKKGKSLSKEEILSFEKEFIGMYVSSHPLDKYKDFILYNKFLSVLKLKNSRKGIYNIVGFVTSNRSRRNKQNRLINFIELEDFSDSIELIIDNSNFIEKNNVYNFTVKISVNGYGNKSYSIVNAEKIEDINLNKIYIKVDKLNEEISNFLIDFSKKFKGVNSVYIYLNSLSKVVKFDYGIDLKQDIVFEKLKEKFGIDNVYIK